MTAEDIRTYCLQKPGTTEDFPFGGDVLVFRVSGKIFALLPLEAIPLRINLKMNPEWIPEYRARYPEWVLPGYHMNKSHWNTVICENSLSKKELCWMLDHSYQLIHDSLPAKKKILS